MTEPGILNAGEIVDRSTLVFRRRFDVDAGRLWRAVSTPEELGRWLMATEMDPRPGGRFRFEGGWSGTIGVLEPPRRIRFDAEAGGSTEFEVEPDGAGSRFVVTDRMAPGATPPAGTESDELLVFQPGGPGTHWCGVAGGWHCFVDSLAAHLAGGTWDGDYRATCEAYRELLARHWRKR